MEGKISRSAVNTIKGFGSSDFDNELKSNTPSFAANMKVNTYIYTTNNGHLSKSRESKRASIANINEIDKNLGNLPPDISPNHIRAVEGI